MSREVKGQDDDIIEGEVQETVVDMWLEISNYMICSLFSTCFSSFTWFSIVLFTTLIHRPDYESSIVTQNKKMSRKWVLEFGLRPSLTSGLRGRLIFGLWALNHGLVLPGPSKSYTPPSKSSTSLSRNLQIILSDKNFQIIFQDSVMNFPSSILINGPH